MFLKFLLNIIRSVIVVLVVIIYIHYFYKQSWGFYTIESNIPLYNIYKVTNGIADSRPLLKNLMSYGMGVSRKGEILYYELYNIVNGKNLNWKLLTEDSLNYITQHSNYTSISKTSEYHVLKGNFLITKTNRPSYVNLKNGEPFQPSIQYILVHISK